MSHTEKTIDSTRIFEGKVVRLRRDTVELENGAVKCCVKELYLEE